MINRDIVIQSILAEERQVAACRVQLLRGLQAAKVTSSDLSHGNFPELFEPALLALSNELRDMERGQAQPFHTVHVAAKTQKPAIGKMK